MTDKELAEIEARWRASTPGEWEENNVGVYSTEAYMTEFLYYHLGGYDNESYNPNSDNDNKFIIQAHNTDIPALLAEVRRLREMLGESA